MKYSLFLLPIIFLGVSSLIPRFFVKNRLDYSKPGTHFTQIIGPISSTFSPRHSGTNIVVLSFKNPGLQNTDQFMFEITDSTNTRLFTSTFSGRNTGDPSNLRFQFPPINSTDKLTITISPSDPSHLEVYVDDLNSLAFTSLYRL